jgi:hypothetical protein
VSRLDPLWAGCRCGLIAPGGVRACRPLAAGHNKAEDEGFSQRKGSSVARTRAEDEGKLACVVCLPGVGSTASSPTR